MLVKFSWLSIITGRTYFLTMNLVSFEFFMNLIMSLSFIWATRLTRNQMADVTDVSLVAETFLNDSSVQLLQTTT